MRDFGFDDGDKPTKEERDARPLFADMSDEEKCQFVAAAMASIHKKMPSDAYPVFLLVAKAGSNATTSAHIAQLRPSLIVALEGILEDLKAQDAWKGN